MPIAPLAPVMAESMTRIIHQNPWRIFCRGIFRPCTQLPDDEIANLFAKAQLDPDLSLGAFDGAHLIGFAVARQCEARLEIFLLEIVRDANRADTVEALLSEMIATARKRSINELAIRPHPLLASSFNLKDDPMLDSLFKMGFWQDVTIAAEMRIDVTHYRLPQKAQHKESRLIEEGFTFHPCRPADLDALDAMSQWRRPPENSFGTLLRDVITQADPKFIILATKDNEVVGYSTFFAGTIMSDLPEYGPVLVKQDLRGKGLAAVMLSKSLMQIVELGKAQQVQLSCYPNKFPIYARQGFHFTNKYLFRTTLRLPTS